MSAQLEGDTRPAGALDRDKQLAVVEQLTRIVATAAGDPSLIDRTWVLLTEAIPGGWGLRGHANTNDELVLAAAPRSPNSGPTSDRVRKGHPARDLTG